MNILDIKNVSFRYNRGPFVLKDINLSIEEGEVVVLLGPSGYGKSTLAQIISGFLRPTHGNILFKGAPLPKSGYRPIQLVYQHPEQAVNPRWKMKDTLYEPGPPEEEVLREMGIQEKWYSRWPNELSGGELQRFCVARALRKDTRLLICDEMTTMLDALNQAHIWNYVLKYAKEHHITLIAITHNKYLAENIANRIIKLPELNHIQVQESEY